MSADAIADLRAAIHTLLLGETEFLAEIAALGFGRNGELAAPTVALKGFRPTSRIPQQQWPCWITESGDSGSTEESIGSCHQTFEVDMLLALVWHQQDFDTAVDQHDALLPALTRLFLRNPCPGDIADVRVDATGADRGVNHPTHISTLRLIATVVINKD